MKNFIKELGPYVKLWLVVTLICTGCMVVGLWAIGEDHTLTLGVFVLLFPVTVVHLVHTLLAVAVQRDKFRGLIHGDGDEFVKKDD